MSVFFIALMYIYYKVSVYGQISPFNKWLLAICSLVVLAIADKVKLLIWVIAVGIMWAIKHFTTKKQNNGRTA